MAAKIDRVPKDTVVKWLLTQGFPFEMAVARELRRAGFNLVQSAYYKDPDEGKAREVDIIASRATAVEAGLNIDIALVVECKVAVKPWIMFVDGSTYSEAQPRFERISNRLGSAWLNGVSFRGDMQSLPLLQVGPRPGYSMVMAQLLNSSKGEASDTAYAAVTSVAKAARVLAEQRDDPTCVLRLPVIVVKGQLFEAWLSTNQEMQVGEIDRGTLIWRNPAGDDPVIIDVVTEEALPRFATEAFASAEALVSHTAEQARKAHDDDLGVW